VLGVCFATQPHKVLWASSKLKFSLGCAWHLRIESVGRVFLSMNYRFRLEYPSWCLIDSLDLVYLAFSSQQCPSWYAGKSLLVNKKASCGTRKRRYVHWTTETSVPAARAEHGNIPLLQSNAHANIFPSSRSHTGRNSCDRALREGREGQVHGWSEPRMRHERNQYIERWNNQERVFKY